jgi:hypothetical protein
MTSGFLTGRGTAGCCTHRSTSGNRYYHSHKTKEKGRSHNFVLVGFSYRQTRNLRGTCDYSEAAADAEEDETQGVGKLGLAATAAAAATARVEVAAARARAAATARAASLPTTQR